MRLGEEETSVEEREMCSDDNVVALIRPESVTTVQLSSFSSTSHARVRSNTWLPSPGSMAASGSRYFRG
jgi:hypothetical protein